jgi:hypothetical protein
MSRRRVGFKSFFDDFLQNVLVQCEISHQTLQTRVLILQLTQLPQLGDTELRILPLPNVESRFSNAHLPTNVCYRCARV